MLGVAVCALTACASNPHRSFYGPAPGSYFVVTVRSGDTLSEIAMRNRVDEDDIAAMNRLRSKHDLHAGQALRIPAYGRVARNTGTHRRNPNARATMPRRTTISATTAATATASTTPRTTQTAYVPRPKPVSRTQAPATEIVRPEPVNKADAVFAWPLDGVVLTAFGTRRNGERNDGINIACSGGEEIRAAAAGTVTYVGNELKSFGNLILIKHENGYTTAYAHADQIKVTRGTRVQQGQVIGTAGSTGDVAEPQLHFEIRRGTTPVDPRPYLRTYGS